MTRNDLRLGAPTGGSPATAHHRPRGSLRTLGLALLPALAGCPAAEPIVPLDVHGFAGGCYVLRSDAGLLVSAGDAVGWGEEGTPLRTRYSAPGTTLLYGPEGGWVTLVDGRLSRQTTLRSDVTEVRDELLSGAEWVLETHPAVAGRYALRALGRDRWIGEEGATRSAESAAAVEFEPTSGCADYPELTLDATGDPGRTTWEDGDVYGFVDMHTHLMTNFAFGGGMFHGSPFHPLGVEHALPDCSVIHGAEGRRDFFGYTYDTAGSALDMSSMLAMVLGGELLDPNHVTAGWPDFTEWPNSRKRATHQTQYHRWLERAWRGGLRLVVQLATSNAVNCHLAVGEGWSEARYDCEDMTAVDRQIDAAYAMERYLDAQAGGPGQGWFRIATTPSEARTVIEDGKLAVVLGIEASDLFDCHLTPRPGGPVCDEAWVDSQLDAYFGRGVRVLFPNHKYDNAFTPGDGSGGFIEAGNFLNSGYKTNKVTEGCPTDIPNGFDRGDVAFGELLEPRDTYQSSPQEDLSDFPDEPVDTLLRYTSELTSGPIAGDHCQNGTLTPVGEHLLLGMMQRGMIIDVDHLPRHSYKRAYELLFAHDYPATGTHARNNNGRLYELGGLSQGGFDRCHDPENPRGALDGYRGRLAQMVKAGMHPSLGFGFDYNGFAGGPRPRFGPDGCSSEQQHPIEYPFASHDGAVTFTQPRAGNRVIDFNTEGMVHIGLLPEYVEDARRDGATDADLEPLFRSAEGYLRMWEKAVTRAAAGAGR